MSALLFHIVPKIGDQLFHRDERVSFFSVATVAVIAFAGFVVIADDPLAFAPIKKQIFQSVGPLGSDAWQLPDFDLDYDSVGEIKSAILQENGGSQHV
jgi:hypothetical protein